MVWAKLGVETRFLDFQFGLLKTTPLYTSFFRMGHFSFSYKPVLNAIMMIVLYVAHYGARWSTISITSSCNPFDASSTMAVCILHFVIFMREVLPKPRNSLNHLATFSTNCCVCRKKWCEWELEEYSWGGIKVDNWALTYNLPVATIRRVLSRVSSMESISNGCTLCPRSTTWRWST